jgi:hypothetical protein
MKVYRIAVLLLALATAVAAVAQPPMPKPAESGRQAVDGPKKGSQPATKTVELEQYDLKDLLENRPPSPVNGMGLKIVEAKLMRDGVLLDQTVLSYVLTYSGPRPPVRVLRPSLHDETLGQTEVLALAKGHDTNLTNLAHAYSFKSGSAPAHLLGLPFAPSKNWFVEFKQSYSNDIIIRTDTLRRLFRAGAPGQFDAAIAPKMYFKIYFAPQERGEEYNFDAWTGKLESNIVSVDLGRW